MSSNGQLAIARTRARLSNRVGYTDKVRHIEISPARALRHLEDVGGTIDFDPTTEENTRIGVKTIWQKIAHQMCLDAAGHPIAKPNDMLRCDSIRLHWRNLAMGFYAARRHLMEDFHQPLFMVPRTLDSRTIQVITYDPDYVVNGVDKAAELAMERGDRTMRSNLRIWMNRYQAQTGAREKITRRFHEIVDQVGRESLPPQRLLLDFSEPAGGGD